jgi:CheY-like chemotaxis protein
LDIRPNIPIMLCTGFSNKINRQKLRRMGIRELILKPFTTGEIAQTIRRILDQR